MGYKDSQGLPVFVSSASFNTRMHFIRVSQHFHYWLGRLNHSLGGCPEHPRILSSIPGLYLNIVLSQL